MKRANQILSYSAAIGAGLLAASAFAQQPPSPQPPANPPAAQSPAAPTQAAPPPAADQRGPRGMSLEDRSAYFDAHIAAIHAGLKLTPDQERLWAPVESAVRDMAKQMRDLREQRRSQAAPSDPVERMARMGEASTKRGQAMTRLAEAARPLYASLTDDQKRRLRTLMRHPGHDGDGRGMMGDDRRHGRHHDRMGGDRRDERGGMRGMHDGDMRGMRGGDMRGDGPRRRGDMGPGRDDDRGGRWNDWR